MMNSKIPALLIATLFAGTASAQNQLPPPDVPAVEAFVKAIENNFYISDDASPFYSKTINLAERYYLTGAPLPNINTSFGAIMHSDVSELSFFNLYWVSDPTASLSDPSGIYFGNTPGIDTPRITASDIIAQTSAYDLFSLKTGHYLQGKTGDVSWVRAPEIDPSSAASGLTLLLGGLAVLRGRRRVSSI
jgi:hypothetical protein